jgi:diguanylate cyclase (GGDEF)-like protein
MVGPAGILNARILIVDDQQANVLLLENMLRGAGYSSLTTTTDPRAVRELYREHRYDLILLDLLMPGMDGFEVMQGLKDIETEGYLPVLVVTAHPGHKLRALEAGAKDFIAKSFDRVEVLTRIHNMLEVRLLLREARSYGKVLEHYDQLTGLPNRTLYRALLARALDRSAERKGMVSVLCVAVDGFANVTDALGPAMGDALLCRVSDRLAGCIGPMDVAARLGGHEFGLIVVTGGDLQDAAMVVDRVRQALLPPLAPEGQDLTVTASIGIAASSTDAPDADSLMRQAETALHAAREAGGDRYRIYTAEMSTRALESLGR